MRKPQGQYKIDWSHPLAKGLKVFVLPTGTYKQNLAGNTAEDLGTAYFASKTINGQTGLYDSSSSQFSSMVVNEHGIDDASDITSISRLYISALNIDIGLFGFNAAQTNSSWLDTSGGNLRVSAYTAYSTHNITSTGFWTGGLVWNADDSVKFVNNGVITDTTTKTRPALEANVGIVSTRNNAESKGLFDDDTVFIFEAIWGRELTPEEINSFCADPYQVLKPVRTVQEAAYAALFGAEGGAIDVSATTASLTLTPYQATVQALVNTDIDATQAAITLTTYQATVDTLTDTDVQADTAAISLVTYAADVQVGANVDVNAITDALTLTTYEATVSALVNTDIQASTASISLATNQATISALVDSHVDAVTAAITLTTYPATVVIDTEVNVQATTASITLTEYDATVQASVNTDIQAVTDALSLVTYAATVTSTVPVTLEDISAQLEALTLKVVDMWKLMGLDTTNPVTTTQTTADVDTIHQDITGDGVNTSTITRTT